MTQWMDSDMEHQEKCPQGSIKGILSINRQEQRKTLIGTDDTFCEDLYGRQRKLIASLKKKKWLLYIECDH